MDNYFELVMAIDTYYKDLIDNHRELIMAIVSSKLTLMEYTFPRKVLGS